MKLNFKQFKKIKDDALTAVLKHPSGHEIRIAKKNLSPGMLKQLSALAIHSEASEPGREISVNGYYDGGEAEAQTEAEIPAEEISRVVDRRPAEDMDQGKSLTPEEEFPPGSFPGAFEVTSSKGAALKSQTPSPTVGQVGRTTAPSAYAEEQFPHSGNVVLGAPKAETKAAPILPEQMDVMGRHLKKIESAYGQMAKQQEQIGTLEEQRASQLAAEKAVQADQAKTQFQTTMRAMNQSLGQADEVLKDLKNGEINPNDYWESKSTAGKVSTAIGIILGGIGAGLTGGENVALKFLNQQIDRNIEAQKQKLGKQRTLLDFYSRKYGTVAAGAQALSALMNLEYASRFEEAGLKAQGPIEKAKANQAAQQFRLKAAEMLYPLEYQRELIKAWQSGRMPDEMIIRTFVPEAQQGEAFKQLKEYRDHVKGTENVLAAFDKLAQDNTLMNRAARAGFNPPSSAAFDNLIAPLIRDAEGKVSEYEQELMAQFKADLFSKKSTVDESRQWLVRWLTQKANFPLLSFLPLKGPVVSKPVVPQGAGSLPRSR